MTIDVLIVSICAVALTAALIHFLTRPTERRVHRLSRQHPTARTDRRG